MPPFSHLRCLVCSLGLLAAFGLADYAAAQTSAHFEMRLAPGQPDAVLTLGSSDDATLTIEMWVEVVDVPEGVLVQSVGVLPRVTQDGVITYNDDYQSQVFTHCVAGAFPNVPASGDLSPLCIAGQGTAVGVGSPGLYGTFTVSAMALGSTSYTYSPTQSMFEVWAVSLTNGSVLEDSDCSAGECNLTGSVEPAMQVIQVVDEPQVARSPDADFDGDVDVADYAFIQHCASLPGPLGPWCLRVDLNWDKTITPADLVGFASGMTGAAPPMGDLDNDGDVDLADVSRYQLCRVRHAEPELANYCRFVDIDRNGMVAQADDVTFISLITGPEN